jgi:hypothetical protein
MRTPRMYVLVRRDLSNDYRGVQGMHALEQYALDHPDQFKLWGNQYIARVGVRNLIELREWTQKLKDEQKIYSVFREPDLDGQETSIACYDNGFIFRDLPLA